MNQQQIRVFISAESYTSLLRLCADKGGTPNKRAAELLEKALKAVSVNSGASCNA